MKDRIKLLELIRRDDLSPIDIYNMTPGKAPEKGNDDSPAGLLGAISAIRKADPAFLDALMKTYTYTE